MLDEIEGRLWTQHGKAFGDQLSALFHDAWDAFLALHAITWSKPWDSSEAGR